MGRPLNSSSSGNSSSGSGSGGGGGGGSGGSGSGSSSSSSKTLLKFRLDWSTDSTFFKLLGKLFHNAARDIYICVYMLRHSAKSLFDLWLFFLGGLIHQKPFQRYHAKSSTFNGENRTGTTPKTPSTNLLY